MKIEIKLLPKSGFWSVWVDGDWVNAALPSREAAVEWVKEVYGVEM